ncbi:MAG: hypothetical protein ACR2IE_12325 [Candidatus Sumerlaeaceae bacterium]
MKNFRQYAGFGAIALGAVAAAALAPKTIASDLAKVSSDAGALRTAIENYAVNNASQYPYVSNCAEPRQNLFLLTTPVAYIATLPTDPFQTTTNTASIFAYRYAEKISSDFCGLNWAQTYGTMPLGANAKWVFVSAGPDYDYDYPGQSTPWGSRFVYDPTNGTASSGDIFIFNVVPTAARNWQQFH